MALKPSEFIPFFEGRFADVAVAFEENLPKNDSHLLARNIQSMSKYKLMIGLLLWRRGQDPRSPIGAAVDVVISGIETLKPLETRHPIELVLPLEEAAIFAWLADVPFTAEPNLDAMGASDRKLSGHIALALRDHFDRAAIDRELATLAAKKRQALSAETYRTYFDILKAGAARKPIADLVAKAEALYLKRARDPFYSGGTQTAGGGPDNEHVVDYILGAVLKKVGYDGPSIHRWRWG